ncbi:hypothetical protein [Pseudomonas sp. MYb118]|uniref:hypothetical protein n=1 Tax=Pseudomonas sp. MYb118 TaxID=1848720 RepID=UPI0034CF54AE
MSTDRQKSFIATLSVDNRHLHFLDVFHGEPVYITNPHFSGGAFTGRPRKVDYSHFLSLRAKTSAPPEVPLTIYFRHADYGYTLYIRTPGQHYGKCLSHERDLVGAFPPGEASLFDLLNFQNSSINLDHIKEDETTVFLKLKKTGVLHVQNSHNSKHLFIGNTGGLPLPFKLKILERNAPYINHPDEV